MQRFLTSHAGSRTAGDGTVCLVGRIGWQRQTRRLVVLLSGSYLLMCVFLASCQRALIFPGRVSQGKKYAQIRDNPETPLMKLTTARGDKIVALFAPATDEHNRPRADAARRPTIVFFYGNGMSLSDCFGILWAWRRLGANVFGVEYPGYGMSGGAPGEAEFYAAADAAYDHLLQRGDIDPHKIIAAGLSIGGGVAVDLAARKPVAALALFAPFTSMDAMARHAAPWAPTSLFLQHHFRSIDKISKLTCPILIARGGHDSIIPPVMSKQLADAAASARVELLEVNSDHNDLFELESAKLDEALARLIERVAETP